MNEVKRMLKLAEVKHKVPLSRTQIYVQISQGRFPRPINIGMRAVAWLESDIDAWIEERAAASKRASSAA